MSLGQGQQGRDYSQHPGFTIHLPPPKMMLLDGDGFSVARAGSLVSAHVMETGGLDNVGGELASWQFRVRSVHEGEGLP